MNTQSIEDKFRELRGREKGLPKSFVSALFGQVHPFGDVLSGAPSTSSAVLAHTPQTQESAPAINPPEVPLEIAATLRSLESFAQKKSGASGEIKFKGGQLAIKESTRDTPAFQINRDIATYDIATGEGRSLEGVQCAFIGHRLGNEWEEYDVQEAADLMLSRMISAMKLEPKDYVLAPFKRTLSAPESDAHWHSLLKELFELNPKVVFLMGANVTASFMGKKERISKLHGQVIRRDFVLDGQTRSLGLMPIFHPEYLLINASMKKAAWEDFQKAMEIMQK